MNRTAFAVSWTLPFLPMTEATRRILLVEDEPMIAFALEDMVLDLGFEVVGPAYRLSEALELAQSASAGPARRR